MDDPEEQRKDQVYCLQNQGVVIDPLLSTLMILRGAVIILTAEIYFQ